MRIDLNQGTQPAAEETNQTATQKVRTAAAQANGHSLSLGEDQAQLSGAHTQVQALAAQAAQLPEVRQEKVQALRQAIGAGRYHVSPEKVADAMLGQMTAGPAA
jgi:flagellar biosynthesis anti-sigma factor FlgM